MREKYVKTIGEAATAKLEAAGLLPTITETRDGPLKSNTVADGERIVVWPIQVRYCTDWTNQ